MVNPNEYNGTQGLDPWDILEGGGRRSVSFEIKDAYGQKTSAPIGTSYTGTLVEDLSASILTKFGTSDPDTYPNGDVKKQIRAVVQTDERTDEEDDGIRAIYFKGQMLNALQQELKEKRAGRVGIGTRFTVTLVDLKAPKTAGFNPQKIYRVDVGPEIVPWTPEGQKQVDAALGVVTSPQVQGAPGANYAEQQWHQPPAVAQPAYQPAANPTFPGQVVPAGQSAAAAAIEAIAAQHQPAQPAALPLVSQEDVDGIATLRRVGLGRDQAISAYADTLKANGVDKGPGFIEALAQAVPVE